MKESVIEAKFYQSLIDSLPSGVIILDEQGLVKNHNRSAAHLLDEPLMGELWRTIIARCFKPQFDDGHEISLKNGRRVQVNTCAFKEGGSAQLVVLHDLTETRALQDKLRHEERLMALGKMVAALAHQIRTPLSSALLYASHFKNAQLPLEKRQDFATKIIWQLKSIERQIKDMLTYSSTGALSLVPLDLLGFMKALQSSLENILDAHNVTVAYEVDDQDIVFLGHQESLIGALQNLILNGVQSVASDAHIKIKANIRDGVLKFEVIDNGPGIPETLQKKVFESFFTTRENGTGLGLAIVKIVVERHQGTLEIDSKQEVGTKITIALPLMENGANHG